MSQSEQKQEQKVVQYLSEAHATEMGLTRVLQSQIAMTPRGSYRSVLEKHLDETRSHAERVQARLSELRGGRSPLAAGLGIVGSVASQALALSKTPFELVRVPVARRRSSRTPRTRARPRRLRSPPTRRSNSSPGRSTTTRRRGWPRGSAPTRRGCSPASCANCPSYRGRHRRRGRG